MSCQRLSVGSAIISGIAALDLGDHAHAVRVIGDRDPVERLSELHRLAAGRRDLLAARESRRVLGAERRAGAAGVDRPGGVHVLVAEVRPLGIVAAPRTASSRAPCGTSRDRPARCRRRPRSTYRYRSGRRRAVGPLARPAGPRVVAVHRCRREPEQSVRSQKIDERASANVLSIRLEDSLQRVLASARTLAGDRCFESRL